MLNTEKLLYILPDLTYLAELLPGKKEHTFTIQSFKQINGKFLDDSEFISANIQKLFTKVDKEEYHLILPDFLFTNTIVNVDDESKTGAKKYVKEKLLPTLGLNDKTHEIEITVLNSFKGNSRVQISAIEKEVLAPIRVASKKSKTIIKAVSPLSWAIKSIVSLEPSITVLQIGNNLYSSQHYIGIDQTNNFPTDEAASIIETIKTLKGAEPSIQTIYLASSSLIEENLKEGLEGTLPIQQLTTYKEEDSKMPSYVKYIIESCMRTLSIPDFPVPKFKLGKASKEDEEKIVSTEVKEEKDAKKKTTKKKDSADSKEKDEKMDEEIKEANSKNAAPDLPEPSKVPEVATMAEPQVEDAITMPEDKKEVVKEVVEEVTIEEPPKEDTEEAKLEKAKSEETEPEATPAATATPEPEEVKPEEIEPKKDTELKEVATEKKEETKSDPVENTEEEDFDDKEEVNLAQFAGKEGEDGEKEVTTDKDVDDKKQTDKKMDKEVKSKDSDSKKKSKKIIKNTSGVNNMLKMVFITLAVFFITIAIGIGVGLGLLKMSDKNTDEEVTAVVVTEPEATPEASATPEPEVEIVKEDLSILVVNATTKAGYAGKIKALLIDGEIGSVTAGNAEGEYAEGSDYILMTEENAQLEKLLEVAADLEFEFDSEVEIEDSDGDYDAVIVLSK